MPLRTRRQFVRTVGAGLVAAPLWAGEKLRADENLRAAEKEAPRARKRLAVVTTLWNYRGDTRT